MLSRILILIALITTTAKANYKFEVNRFNETLLSFNQDVLGVNCSPASRGSIFFLDESNSSAPYFLRFVPEGKMGSIYCSFKLASSELLSVKFVLGDNVKNPIVDISRPLKKPSNGTTELGQFVAFIKGSREGLKSLSNNGRSFYSFGKNRINFVSKYISSQGLFFYEFKSSQLDPSLKLNNVNFDEILYSSVLKEKDSDSLFIASKKEINFYKVFKK